MRNYPAGSVLEAASECVEAFGGVKKAGETLGLNPSNVSRSYSGDEDRPGGMGTRYLDTLGRVKPHSVEPMASHFARLARGVFIPLPGNGPIATDIHKLTKEFSDVLQHHAESHSEKSADPSDYTPQEAQRQVKEVLDVMQVGAALVAALQARYEP